MSSESAGTAEGEPFATERLIEAAYVLGDDPVLVVEWQTRRILACTDSVTRVFGYEPSELLGGDTRCLHVSQAAFESFGATNEAFIESGHSTYHCHFRMRRKDGSEFPSENLVQLIHDLDEGHVAVVSFVRDLSGSTDIEPSDQAIDAASAHPLSMHLPGLVFRRVRDVQGNDRYTYMAGRLLNDLGIDPAAAREDPNVIFNLMEPNDHRLLESVISSSAKSLCGIDLVVRLRSPDGGWFWIRTISRPTKLDDGSVVWDGVSIDITAEKKAQEDATWLATHDRLTGLLARAAFIEHVASALNAANRKSRHFVLVHLGVRGMFTINETHGLEGGDELLRGIADRLVDALAEGDIVARSHGDVFLAKLEVGHNEGDLARAIERIRTVFHTPFALGDRDPVRVEVSIGVARYPGDSDTAEGLLRAVALAGERARRAPELSYEFYDRAGGEHMRGRFLLETSLRQAIENEQLEPYYQPQVSLADRSVVGLEALVRWPQADGSLVHPGDFIPLAEETGLSGPIGRLTLKRVSRDLRTWSERGRRTVAVAVNCSARQFRDAGLVEAYTQDVIEQGIDPGLVHFEITESSLIDNFEHAEQTMARLNAMGVAFAIDDFGTGYSSLSYLSRLPFTMLKIDRSFVANVLDDAHQRKIVLGLVRMASAIGLYVVAEGIETAEQEAEMRRLGCDAAQGFYYSPALSAEDIESWLETT